MFAVDDGEEDGVEFCSLTFLVGTLAEHKSKGIGGLMPRSMLLDLVWLVGGDVWDARELKRVGEVEGCKAGTDYFRKGAATGGGFGVGDVIVNERFASERIKEHPVLLDLGSAGSRVPC